MKNIELKNSFSEYVLNELVTKLRELDPEDYDNRGQELDVSELLELLLEDEQANGCYYLYTLDSEQVFATYFKDILFVCGRFGFSYANTDLNAGTLLLAAMENAFADLLQYFEHAIEVAGLKFDRAGLNLITDTLLDMYPAKIEDLIFD